MRPIKLIPMIKLTLCACFIKIMLGCSQSEEGLLDITVEGTVELNKVELAASLNAFSQNKSEQISLQLALAQHWSYVAHRATRSLFQVSKSTDRDTLRATVILDGVPEDDSVSGYRYDLKLRGEAGYWQVISAEQSHRCWPGRGHQSFSSAPCI